MGNPWLSVMAPGGSGGNPRWLRAAEAPLFGGVRRGVVGSVLLSVGKSARRFPHDGRGPSSCIRSHERMFGASKNTCDRFGPDERTERYVWDCAPVGQGVEGQRKQITTCSI